MSPKDTQSSYKLTSKARNNQRQAVYSVNIPFSKGKIDFGGANFKPFSAKKASQSINPLKDEIQIGRVNASMNSSPKANNLSRFESYQNENKASMEAH